MHHRQYYPNISRADEIMPTAKPLISMRAERLIKTSTGILDAFYASQEWFCGWHQQVLADRQGRTEDATKNSYSLHANSRGFHCNTFVTCLTQL
jgi:hypothetical protein